MKHCNLLILLVTISFYSYSQPWMTNIQPTKSGRVSYIESKKYIDNYLKNNPDGDLKYLKQFNRAAFIYDYRMDENGKLPSELYWNEALKSRQENRANDYSEWQALGPFDTPQKLTSDRVAGNGRIDCITFHPNDENTIYVGTPSGGLWKSIDGGESWFTLTDNIPSIGIADVDLHPDNPEEIYICTGTRDTWWETFSVGILKSSNSGETWEPFALEMNPHDIDQIHELFINPYNPDIMIAATTNGLYRTEDGGENWSRRIFGDFMEIAAMPGDSSVIYASTFDYYNCNSKIYKSTDAGLTFQELSNTGINTSQVIRTTLATTPSNPDVIYALTSKCDNSFDGVYRSFDAGETWEKATNSGDINVLGYYPAGNDNGGQGYYTLSIGIDPLNENHIWVGGVNIWESFNAGDSWQLNAQYLGLSAQYVHADIHSFNINPLNNKLYNANDGGIYVYDENGDWQSISNGLEIMQFYRLGIFEQDINTILASPQDNGTMLRKNDAYREIALYEACEVIFDRDDAETFYFGGFALGYQRTHDGGQTFVDIQPNGETNRIFNIPFAMHPENDSILYFGGTEVYKSLNQGDDWIKLSTVLHNTDPISILTLAPSNPEVIYVGTMNNAWVTFDDGRGWEEINIPNIPYTYLKDIEVSPNDPQHVWISYAGFSSTQRIYESTDGGNSFNNIGYSLPRLPVNCITHDQTQKEGLYIGTDAGIYFRDNTMDDWVLYSEGLPNVMINEMEIHRETNKIVAATYGRGLWVNDVINPMGESSNLTEKLHSLKVYPNPANSSCNIEYYPKEASEIALSVSNAAGKIMYSKNLQANKKREVYQIPIANFNPGIYLIKIHSKYDIAISKLIVE